MGIRYNAFRKRVGAIQEMFYADPDGNRFLKIMLEMSHDWQRVGSSHQKAIDSGYALRMTYDMEIQVLHNDRPISIENSQLPDDIATKLNGTLNDVKAVIYEAEEMAEELEEIFEET